MAGAGERRSQPPPAGCALLGEAGCRAGAVLHSDGSGACAPGAPAETDGCSRDDRGRSFGAAAGVLSAARGEPGEVGARWLRGVSPASAQQGSARSALHRCLPGGPSDGQRMAAGEL